MERLRVQIMQTGVTGDHSRMASLVDVKLFQIQQSNWCGLPHHNLQGEIMSKELISGS